MGARRRHGSGRPTIFISYRRTDSGGHSGRLHNTLRDYYGGGALFLDHADLEVGVEWQRALANALEAADVVLVVIGPDWLAATDEAGNRRLDDPADWVRVEVENGLDRADTRVIPVLVGGASLPTADELPASLGELAGRQAHEIRPKEFEADAADLIRSIGGWRSRFYGLTAWGWTWRVAALVAIVALIVGLVVASRRGDDNKPPELLQPQSLAVQAGEPGELDLLADVIDDDGGAIELQDVDPLSAEGGDIVIVRDGVVEYRPRDGFHGADVFTYRVADDDGAVSEWSVAVDVAIGRMRGDFNVAVAQFAEVHDDQTSVVTGDSRELADTVHVRIDEELAALNESGNFNFEVRSPTDTGAIEGATRAERARAASDLASDIAADVVVYGALTGDGIHPEFFVQAREPNLGGAEELTGDYELGERILGSSIEAGSITDNFRVREALSARARALTQFVIALSWYGGGDYDESLDALEAADVPEWREADGKEILYLFLGNTSGKLQDRAAAGEHYRTALAINPDFARAILGEAEVDFFGAAIDGWGGGCAPGDVDPEGLERSEQTYREALVADDRPAISNVDAKVAFGLGRVYLCMTLAGIDDRSADAQANFDAVIGEFEAGNDSIRSLAVEAYANGAALLHAVADVAAGPAPFCEAIERYGMAIDLADDRRSMQLSEVRDSLLASVRSTGADCD